MKLLTTNGDLEAKSLIGVFDKTKEPHELVGLIAVPERGEGVSYLRLAGRTFPPPPHPEAGRWPGLEAEGTPTLIGISTSAPPWRQGTPKGR